MVEYFALEGVTLLQSNDEQVESTHSKLRKREENFNLKLSFWNAFKLVWMFTDKPMANLDSNWDHQPNHHNNSKKNL